MKKVLVAFFAAAVLCSSAFAEKLTVSYVEGKVLVQLFANRSEWTPVTEGMILDTEDSINVGLNSSVAFESGDYIKPMKKGKLEDLLKKNNAAVSMVLGTKLNKESIKNLAALSSKSESGVARASEAKEDLEWDE